MDCPQCYENLEEGAAQCPGCGWIDSNKEIPAAVAAAVETHRWVDQWKSQFEEHKIVLPPEALERARSLMERAERQMRLASIVFADLTGFSAESRISHPEAIDEVLGAFCQIVTEVAMAYDGFVASIAGDGVQMVFGAPLAYDSDVENAVAAAQELVARLQELKWPEGNPVRARAGVATGEVLSTITKAGTLERYDVFGETVNLAARLEQNAKPGQVLVCENTLPRIAHLFRLQATPPLALKNISDDYIAHEIVSERQAPESARSTDMRFVGRSEELRKIRDGVLAAGEMGFFHAEVIGEPGIGKTRLLLEAQKRMEGEASIVFFNGVPHGRHILFHPLIQWMRRHLQMPNDLPPGEIQFAVNRYFQKTPELDEADALLLGYLFGTPESLANFRDAAPERLRENLFRLFLDLTRAHCSAPSLVLVLDDMQWADGATAAWADFLIASRPPGLSVVELIRSDTERGGAHSSSPENIKPDLLLHIPPLGSEEQRELLHEVLPIEELTPELEKMLEYRASGNPLFSVELARAVDELVAEGKEVALSEEEIGDLVPDTLQSVVQWRIDRLSEHARLVLQCGAVLGMEFARGLLELIEQVREDLQERLHLLKAQSYLKELPKISDHILRFCNPVTRDVAYRLLLPEQKRSLHESVAEQMEVAFPEAGAECSEVLAYHWSKADNHAKAVYWLIKSAERRHAMGAYRESLSACDKALELLRTKATPTAATQIQTMRLLTRSGRIKTSLGEYPEAQKNLDEALTIAKGIKNIYGEAEALLWRAILRLKMGEIQEALPRLEEAEKLARELNLDRLIVPALNARGLIAWQQAQLDDALGLFREVGEIGKKHDNSGWCADALNNSGLVLWKQGLFHEALQSFRDSLAPYKAIRDMLCLANALTNIGTIEQHLDHRAEARTNYANAQEIAKKIGNRICLATLCLNLSNLLRVEGDYSAAAEQAAQGADLSRVIGDPCTEAYALANLARALIGRFPLSPQKEDGEDIGLPASAQAPDQLRQSISHALRANRLAKKDNLAEEAALEAALTLLEARLALQSQTPAQFRRAHGAILDRIIERTEKNEDLGDVLPRALRIKALALALFPKPNDPDASVTFAEKALQAARAQGNASDIFETELQMAGILKNA